jgi:hypothetical protein
VSEQLINSVVSVATAIVGLAIIAVLVSNKASTSSVIGAATSGFANDLTAATNPYSGGGNNGLNLSSLTQGLTGGGGGYLNL